MPTPYEDVKVQLLEAALAHVPFDGWSEATLKAAISETGMDEGFVRAMVPRGAVDLALAFHAKGDRMMLERMKAADLSSMKIREKVTAAVRFRIEAIDDKEAVRRGVTLFALPMYAADGTKAILGTADLIWDALGDPSKDYNWYTKRAILSGVYSSTVLYWLGDDSLDQQATWEFLGRRIENVMQIEKVKAQVNDNPMLKPFMAGPNWLLSHIKAPMKMTNMDLPGMTELRD